MNRCQVLTTFKKQMSKVVLSADFPHAALNTKMSHPIFYVHLVITVNLDNVNVVPFSSLEPGCQNRKQLSFLTIQNYYLLRLSSP